MVRYGMMNARIAIGLLVVIHCLSGATFAPADGIESLIDDIRVRHDQPALAVAVVKGGKTVAVITTGARQHKKADAPVTIDDRFHMQMFTPRKPKSAWSATNKARVAALIKSGLMTPAGLAAIALAKKTGTWNTYAHVDSLAIPLELQRAFDANPDAKKNWPTYTPSAQRSFLHMVNNAKRPETRERNVARVIDLVARKVSMTELRKQAMQGKKLRPPSP